MVWSGRLSKKGLCACVVILVIAASTHAAAAKAAKVTVTVNGKPYAGWLEHGVVVGPLEPFARAVGLDASWDSSRKALSVEAASPWVDVPPPIGENNHPYELTALGPIMAARRTLDDEQFSSLQQWKDESTPVLVRYEIVNAYNMTQGAMKLRELQK